MNKFEELNYYEILEIPVNASSFEIRRAYRNAVEVYSDHSFPHDAGTLRTSDRVQ